MRRRRGITSTAASRRASSARGRSSGTRRGTPRSMPCGSRCAGWSSTATPTWPARLSEAVPNSTVCLSFDFDALSVWFGFEHTTPAMLNRGEYGARVGVPRVLELLERHDVRATFFVPGHTVESFPEETAAILERGHEVAAHSYAHVDPSRQTPDEERADMERALAAL